MPLSTYFLLYYNLSTSIYLECYLIYQNLFPPLVNQVRIALAIASKGSDLYRSIEHVLPSTTSPGSPVFLFFPTFLSRKKNSRSYRFVLLFIGVVSSSIPIPIFNKKQRTSLLASSFVCLFARNRRCCHRKQSHTRINYLVRNMYVFKTFVKNSGLLIEVTFPCFKSLTGFQSPCFSTWIVLLEKALPHNVRRQTERGPIKVPIFLF